MDELKKGNKVTDVSKDYYLYFGPSVQPYLISEFKYDPAVEIKKLNIPVLIIQGTIDLQVTVDDAPIDQKKNLKTYSNLNYLYLLCLRNA